MKKQLGFSSPIDKYEEDLEQALSSVDIEFKPVPEKTRKMLQQAAREHISKRKNKSVTFRLNQNDLEKLKAKAKQNRIPYQTLIGTLIHQYVEGKTKIVL